jgi:hypothetical protein
MKEACKMAKHSPTAAIELEKQSVAIRQGRRPKRQAPEIYVRIEQPFDFAHFAKAHLRNKRGYVYLCWRKGRKILTFYLGKQPRSYPTGNSLELAGAGDVRGAARRIKTSHAS